MIRRLRREATTPSSSSRRGARSATRSRPSSWAQTTTSPSRSAWRSCGPGWRRCFGGLPGRPARPWLDLQLGPVRARPRPSRRHRSGPAGGPHAARVRTAKSAVETSRAVGHPRSPAACRMGTAVRGGRILPPRLREPACNERWSRPIPRRVPAAVRGRAGGRLPHSRGLTAPNIEGLLSALSARRALASWRRGLRWKNGRPGAIQPCPGGDRRELPWREIGVAIELVSAGPGARVRLGGLPGAERPAGPGLAQA